MMQAQLLNLTATEEVVLMILICLCCFGPLIASTVWYRRTFPKRLRIAEEMGTDARRKGLTKASCPYASGDELAAWERGFSR